MSALYPLKFNAIIKNKIWGGERLAKVLNKEVDGALKAGESWEISAVQGDLSLVKEGYLAGNNIEEIIEVYMGDLVGEKVYDKFGVEFPLLIKFIDANDWLSIQVHPDDAMAKARHNSYGKTEMWYIVDAEKDAELIAGFNQALDKEKYLQHFGGGTLREVLNFEKVQAGDVFFMPAGRVHATGPGILFAEIQQTSDVTYRIYDWDRLGDDGKPRELHTDLAIDAIDFKPVDAYKTSYAMTSNVSSEVISSPYFKTNILSFNKEVEVDYNALDSFVIYMGLEGEAAIHYAEDKDPVRIAKGETVLMPAVLTNNKLLPVSGSVKLLEVWMP